MSALRILLIDDNRDDRTLALRELGREFSDVRAIEINDLNIFKKALDDGNFDLVITDYQLRWTTGLKILKAVKKRYPQRPVVMFTGTGSEEVAVSAMKAGLDDYVIKSPKHYVRLAAAVRSAWERERLRRDRQEVERRYRRLFEDVPVGLYRLTREGQFIEANPGLTELLGYQRTEDLLAGRSIDAHLDGDSYRLWRSKLQTEGLVRDLETPLRRCDGTIVWVRHSARAVFQEGTNIRYYEGAIENIDQRKQAEMERDRLLDGERRAREEAETANRVKDDFLATLSHELRTPLNGMLGWVQLARRGTLNSDQLDRALEIIERNARAQTQLIEDLLDISRLVRGELRLHLEPLDLREPVEAAIDIVRPSAEAKSITVQTDFTSEPARVRGDRDRLQQIVWNLLTNAIKFTPAEGSVAVSIESLPDCIRLRVRDTGQGIEPAALPHIFDRFRQGDSSLTRTFGGLGLGLAIVRHFSELHGGTAEAESAGKDMGASFTVELPRIEG